MFDTQFAAADDAAVVDAIAASTRAEAIAAARRSAAIAELARRRVTADEELSAFDGWDSAAAEVAAAMGVGHQRASAQMSIALALRNRLPRVAELYLRGLLSSRLISTITWRTHLILDADILTAIDAAIAARATGWGALSDAKLNNTIDALISQHDPDAVRNIQAAARGRDIYIGHREDEAGTTTIWGRLLITHAELIARRIQTAVDSVCPDDPRSMGERRSDALGAVAAGEDFLVCGCGSQDCPAGDRPAATNVVVHVLAEQATVDAATETPPPETAAEPETPAAPAASAAPRPALLLGRGVLPTFLLGQVLRSGARVRPIRMPSDQPEPGYRPSAKLAEFVRLRDLFCRFVGCDVPADRCDIDHTVPWPVGPTHASNLKCDCRKHHLMKTFGGWQDVQLPDGTVIWTSPTGRTYTTKPGGQLFFPTWVTTTADLPPPPTPAPFSAERGLKMPQRRRTRAADRLARINAERARNMERIPF